MPIWGLYNKTYAGQDPSAPRHLHHYAAAVENWHLTRWPRNCDLCERRPNCTVCIILRMTRPTGGAATGGAVQREGGHLFRSCTGLTTIRICSEPRCWRHLATRQRDWSVAVAALCLCRKTLKPTGVATTHNSPCDTVFQHRVLQCSNSSGRHNGILSTVSGQNAFAFRRHKFCLKFRPDSSVLKVNSAVWLKVFQPYNFFMTGDAF